MTFCKMCGAEIEENVAFCPACGAEQTVNEFNNGFQPQENQFYNNFQQPVVAKKKKSKAPIIIVAVVAVIAVVVGVLFATGVLGGGGLNKALEKAGLKDPAAVEVFDAAKKTIFESPSLTVEATDGDTKELVQISFGKDAEDIKLYVEEDGEGYYGIYNGITYEYHGGTGDVSESFLGSVGSFGDRLSVDGAEDMVNNLFNGKFNEAAFKNIFNAGLRDGFNNYMKMLYIYTLETEEEMMEYIIINDDGSYDFDFDKIPVSFELPDYDAIMEAIDDFLRNGITEDAIKFEVKDGTYKFEINAAEFLICLSDFIKENDTMKNLVESVYKITNYVDELEGENYSDIDIHDELEALADECKEENYVIKCKAEIDDDGYLTYLKIDDGQNEPLEITISKIGSTTVDKADIDAIDTEDPYADSHDDYYGYHDDYEARADIVKVVDIALSKEEYAIGVDKDQPELLTEVNSFIKKIQQDGTLDGIFNKYLGNGTPTGVASAELDPSKDQLVVATNAEFAPFEYKEEGLYYGIDMEIASLLAQELGKELVIVNMDFDAVCLAVAQKQCDVAIAGLPVTAEREESVDFSVSYYNASQKIIVMADDTRFDYCYSVEDVEYILDNLPYGTQIGVQSGTTGEFYVEGSGGLGFPGIAGAEAVTYYSINLAFQDLLNGRTDMVIADAIVAEEFVEKVNALS